MANSRKDKAAPRFLDRSNLDHAARAVAEYFKADTVVIVGSQATLVQTGQTKALTLSPEIDLYPDNRAEWEADHPGEIASEEIDGLFGNGSPFAIAHGFFLDGVDERTATLPSDWRIRAHVRRIDAYGRAVDVIAPATEDLIAAKLCRLDDKDKLFAMAAAEHLSADLDVVADRLRAIDVEDARRALALDFVARLKASRSP